MEGKDIVFFACLYISITNVHASVSFCGVIQEWYEISLVVRDKLNAVEVKSPIPCYGDFILTCHYQVLSSNYWVDIVSAAMTKIATGSCLCDVCSRYTDAAAYWFDCNIRRTVWQDPDTSVSIRFQRMADFYCWMTNNLQHQQNDLLMYALGRTGYFSWLYPDVILYQGISR